MGSIRQTWILKSSRTWSKKDAKYIIDSLVSGESSTRTISKLNNVNGIYDSRALSSKLIPRQANFQSASPYDVWKLGWTFFQKEREDFHCRESLTYNLQRQLVDTGKNIQPKRMCIVREYLPKGDKYSFLEEHWPKFIDAFLGMCGVSKNIRTSFVKYDSKTGYAVFPASIALWRSTFFTAPSTIVGLMRSPNLIVNPKLKSLNTIPEILDILVKDKEKSWETGGKRMYRYSSFGTNSMLWFTLLWMNKIREVSDGLRFKINEHYADGPNNFVSCTRKSIARVLSNFDVEEKKELYLLLGGNNQETFDKVASNFTSEISQELITFKEVI